MEDRKIRVGITHGDTNGIGYEIIFKTFAEPTMLTLCTPIIYGSPKLAAYHRNLLKVPANFVIINNTDEIVDGKINLIAAFDEDVRVDIGEPTHEAGMAAFKALERAVKDYREGIFDVLVTAPINKNTIQSDDFHFCGHTEFIQDRLGEGAEALMILFDHHVKVAVVTTHLPVSEIASHITKEAIMSKARIFNQSLKRDFRISSPRIAVLALNPHAGDNGLLGTEEQDIIKPAIEELAAEEINAFGPYPADGFFGSDMMDKFDGVLAMYHDQGLAPFKAIAGDEGVNYTAGLPIVRTSPSHGTAYDIAGKCVADENSFRQAIYTAIDIYRNRIEYDIPYADPLKKLYHEKRDDSEKARFNIPSKRRDFNTEGRGERPEKGERPERNERPEKGERQERPEKNNRPDRNERQERRNQSQGQERPAQERPQTQERPQEQSAAPVQERPAAPVQEKPSAPAQDTPAEQPTQE